MKETVADLELRHEAERILDQASEAAKDPTCMSSQDNANLIHELRVHQIELKMQNDELRRIQAELEKTRDRYVHLYDFAPTAYFTVNEKGAVVEANLTAATLLDLPRANLVGQMFSRFIHREDQDVWYRHRKHLLESSDFQSLQLRLVKPDGALFYVNLECMPAAGSDGEPDAIRISATDVTSLKQVEQALQQANTNLEQRVSERTSELAQRNVQLQKLAVELIEAEERERHRIAELLHDDLQQILAAARMQLQSVLNELPHVPLLEEIDHMLSESITKSRRLSHELSPAILHHSGLVPAFKWLCQQMKERFGMYVQLVSDAAELFGNMPYRVFLFRAVHELLFNVVKHAGVKSARVDLGISDSKVFVKVSDHGIGFDPAILNNMPEKAGLGLLSLRLRASYIGGSFNIESAPGKGCKFSISIPLSMEFVGVEKNVCPATPLNMVVKSGTIRILLADDHKVMRDGLIRIIQVQPGIEIVGEAANGLEAIELARQHRPDVIIMDVGMPDMDGIEATRLLKTELPDARIVGLSMFKDDSVAQRMFSAGADAFVFKTASSAELLKAIYGASD